MTGQEVYRILRSRNVLNLFHANSVKTSISLLRLGGLASRKAVEQASLAQTSQYTDAIDKKFGIWGDVFMDTVDIHDRISDRNKYGPVSFVMDISFLNHLPETTRVLVTRLNPSKWTDTDRDERRYFMSAGDLSAGLSIGDFDQMLVIRIAGGIIHFGESLLSINLDDPKSTQAASPEYGAAERALREAAENRIDVEIVRRECSPCRCVSSYSEPATRIPYFYGVR